MAIVLNGIKCRNAFAHDKLYTVHTHTVKPFAKGIYVLDLWKIKKTQVTAHSTPHHITVTVQYYGKRLKS